MNIQIHKTEFKNSRDFEVILRAIGLSETEIKTTEYIELSIDGYRRNEEDFISKY